MWGDRGDVGRYGEHLGLRLLLRDMHGVLRRLGRGRGWG